MNQRNLSLRRAIASTLALSCAIAATESLAQDQPGGKSEATLGAIIVTAQKREQNLQDVPVVVTALNEEMLHDSGVKDIKDMTVLTPGLTVTSTSSEALTTARIRGVGTVGDNPGLESSVGVIIDGVYRPRNGVGFGDLGEMERIEVLKGPQGTLFGKNTTAGVINVVSKKPNFTPSANLEFTAGNYNDIEGSASFNNVFVDDKLANRLFVAVRKRDGLLDIRNAGTSPTTDMDRNYYTVREQLLLKASDSTEMRLIADITERDENCCGAVQIVHGSATVPGLINALASGNGVATVPDPYARVGYANRATESYIKDRGVSLEVTTDLGDSEFTSITAGRDWFYRRGQDSDFSGADLLYRQNDGTVFTRFQQITEEMRWAGKAGPINYLFGGFYAKEKLNSGDSLRPGTALSTFISYATVGGPTLPGTWGVTSPMTGAAQDRYEQSSESVAIFTNDSIEITDGLEATIGARYTWETKDLNSFYWNANSTATTTCQQIRNGIAGGQIPIGSLPASSVSTLVGVGCLAPWDPNYNSLNQQESLDEGKFTGTAKLQYRFNDMVMSYLSYALGYKASGFNLDRQRMPNTALGALANVFPLAATDKSFKPEEVDSFEAGAKLSLADEALLLNFAGFYQTYKDFQYNTFTGVQFEVRSLDEVRSYGVDADLLYRTRYGLGVNAGVTYSFTDITKPGAGATGLFSPNRESWRMPFAPVVSASLGVNYKQTVGDFALGGSVSAKYNSDYNTGSNLDPRKIQDSYTLVNARLSFGAEDDSWAIELWGQNITDEEYAQVMFDATFQGSASNASSTIDAFLGAQRLFGASVIFKIK